MKIPASSFGSLFVICSLIQTSGAATLEWSGSSSGLSTGTSNTWNTNTTANWWNGSSLVNWPALGGTNDDAVFGGTAGTVTVTTATANDITFNTTGYVISSGTLTLNGTTPTLSTGTGIDATISSVIAGSAGLTKSGGGTLILSGANTFTGVTNINSGILRAGNAAALGSSTNGTTVASGATLDLNGQNLGAEVVTISGTGVGGAGAVINTGASQTQALRFLTLAGNSSIGGTGRWDLRANTTGTLNLANFTLTKTGSNYIGLVGVTTTPGTGQIVIDQGELSVQTATNLAGSSANKITVNNGATLGMWGSTVTQTWTVDLAAGSTFRAENGTGTNNTWGGAINLLGNATLRADGVLSLNGNIGGTGDITKTAGSVLTLRGANTFAGSTSVNAGTLTLDYINNDNSKLHDASSLTLGGGTLSLANGTHSEVVASTTLTAGTNSSISRASGTAVINLNTITVGAGATLNLGGSSIATTDNLNTNGILGGWATVGNDWATNSTNSADGLITAYTGYTLSSVAGTSAANYASAHVDVDASQTIDGAISSSSLRFNTAGALGLTLQGTNTVAGGILVGSVVGNNLSSLSGGSITGSLNSVLVINQRNTSNALSISSNLVDNGTTGLLKIGTGAATLSGTNSYSGVTTIASGQLQIGSSGALGNTSNIVTSGANGASLVLNDGITTGSGKSVTIVGGGASDFFGALSTSGSATWEGSVLIGAATSARIGTLGSGVLTVSGNISEPGGTPSELLIRANTGGAVVLSGNNTHTGGTTLVFGGLRMGSANALGSGTLTLGGGTNPNNFSSDGTTARTISNAVVFNATTTHNLGDAALNGKLTFTGPLSVGGANRTLGINSTVEFANAVSSTGNFGIIKTGSADLILSAANSYTGATQINGGTLVVAHKDALATSSSVFPSTANGSGTLRLATDTSAVINRIETSSSNPGTIVSDRATVGAGINHSLGELWAGANTYTFAAGSNVTSGTAGLTFSGLNLTAGAASTAILNPTTAVVTVTGGVSIGLNNQVKTLRLDGTSSGNLISGAISNGLNTLSITKTGTSEWELSGVNTQTGATTVSNGTLTLSGNRVAASGGITVGNVAGQTGTLNIRGDLPVGGSEFGVGTTVAGAVGIVNHSAGLVSFTSGNAVLIGRSVGGVTGTYNLSGGELRTFASGTRGVMIGVNAGSSGNLINATFNLSGTGLLNNSTGSLQVVRGDATSSFHNSTYNQTGGTSNNGSLIIGGGISGINVVNAANGQNSTATVSITGGTFTTTTFNGLSRADNVVSNITIGGTADVTLPAFPTVRGVGSTATLTFDGGTLKPSASSSAYLGGLTNAFIQDGGARIDTNGFDITVSQNLLEDTGSTGGGLTKDGTGTLTLSGSGNTYTGDTVVNGGTLAVTGDISFSTTLVNNGGTIAGNGTTGSLDIANGGTLAPGLSPGTLSVGGDLGLNSASLVSFEFNPLDTTVGGGINDLVNVTGNLNLDGLLTVTATSGDFTSVTSGTWRLFNYSGTLVNNGLTFDSLPTLSAGYTWELNTATSGQVNLVVIPEPRIALLGALGLLFIFRRRRP
ncbi:MAG: autotransporter-associated beta strand repeat-containing protein [Akkermansiaceae bacterium]|nr:autotransporter-associated beta strand repeat-containing protein [Akkermansiaceae bacterium]